MDTGQIFQTQNLSRLHAVSSRSILCSAFSLESRQLHSITETPFAYLSSSGFLVYCAGHKTPFVLKNVYTHFIDMIVQRYLNCLCNHQFGSHSIKIGLPANTYISTCLHLIISFIQKSLKSSALFNKIFSSFQCFAVRLHLCWLLVLVSLLNPRGTPWTSQRLLMWNCFNTKDLAFTIECYTTLWQFSHYSYPSYAIFGMLADMNSDEIPNDRKSFQLSLGYLLF